MKRVLPVLYRDALIRLTSPLWFFFDLLVPVLYLLMFGVGFNSAFSVGIVMDGKTLTYNEFFLAGVIGMACFGLAINQSYGFFVDRDNGIFYETLTYPITRGEYLLGKILFQCVLAIFQTILTLTAAHWLLGVSIPWSGLWLIAGGVLLGTAGWFFTFAAMVFMIRRSDTYNTVINVAYFVLMFVSSLFYPVAQLPKGFAIAAYVNPVTWHTDVVRWALVGVGDPTTIVVEAAGFLVFTVVAFWVALRSLEKAV